MRLVLLIVLCLAAIALGGCEACEPSLSPRATPTCTSSSDPERCELAKCLAPTLNLDEAVIEVGNTCEESIFLPTVCPPAVHHHSNPRPPYLNPLVDVQTVDEEVRAKVTSNWLCASTTPVRSEILPGTPARIPLPACPVNACDGTAVSAQEPLTVTMWLPLPTRDSEDMSRMDTSKCTAGACPGDIESSCEETPNYAVWRSLFTYRLAEVEGCMLDSE